MLLRQLEYVLAVAELKSFTKAADRCCVTQSTLSIQIKSLEDYLDVQFFDRSSNPVKLTPEGEHLIYQVKEIVSKAKHFEKYAKNLTKHPIHANY